MALTSLPFYRKNQSLHDIENERPKSLESLRETIIKAVEEVEFKVSNLEKEFNGGKSHLAEVRNIVPIMQNLMNVFEWTYINSTQNIQEIMEFSLEPSEVFRVDMHAIQTVKDYYRKLIEFMPGRFEDILEDVERILKSMTHYCLSFCPPEALNSQTKNHYLETPIHFELKRLEFIKAIRMHLDNIRSMCIEMKEANGVRVKAFGLATNELARACDCGVMPLFLVFPEACYNMRNACSGVRKWVSEDAIYSTFLQNDIVTFETRRVEQDKKMRTVRDEGIHVEHVIKTTRRQVDELEIAMKKMNKREKHFLSKIHTLHQDIKIMETEIKEKESAREFLSEKAEKNTDWTEEDLEEEQNYIASVIANNRIKIPETRHKIEALKNSQQKLIISKRELLNQKHAELVELDKMAIMFKGRTYQEKMELKKVEDSLGILKDIYIKKTSPDVTKKIFNNMPVQPRNIKQLPKRPIRPAPKIDPLDRASKVVANAIKGDWPKLYRNLPFYPPRGEFDKDDDVDRVFTQGYRGDDKMRARESLDKWRRVNSIANINSLKEVLGKMNREDILAQVERRPVINKNKMKVKRGKQNWSKIQKFKVTLGKIMDLQNRAHEHQSETKSVKSVTTKSQAGSHGSRMTHETKTGSESESLPKRVHFASKEDLLGHRKKAQKTGVGKSQDKWYLPKEGLEVSPRA